MSAAAEESLTSRADPSGLRSSSGPQGNATTRPQGKPSRRPALPLPWGQGSFALGRYTSGPGVAYVAAECHGTHRCLRMEDQGDPEPSGLAHGARVGGRVCRVPTTRHARPPAAFQTSDSWGTVAAVF